MELVRHDYPAIPCIIIFFLIQFILPTNNKPWKHITTFDLARFRFHQHLCNFISLLKKYIHDLILLLIFFLGKETLHMQRFCYNFFNIQFLYMLLFLHFFNKPAFSGGSDADFLKI